MRKLISGVLILVLVIGSLSGIYSAHYCLSVNHLKTKGLGAQQPESCSEKKGDCCKESTKAVEDSCCISSEGSNSLTENQFTTSGLIVPTQHAVCCVKVTGFFGIPLFKTAIQNYGDYFHLFSSSAKEDLFGLIDTEFSLAQNYFHPPDFGSYYQYQSFLQVFKI